MDLQSATFELFLDWDDIWRGTCAVEGQQVGPLRDAGTSFVALDLTVAENRGDPADLADFLQIESLNNDPGPDAVCRITRFFYLNLFQMTNPDKNHS